MSNERKDSYWNGLFSRTILNRGWEYYRKGKAKKIIRTNEGYQITVRGSRNYCVTIYSDEDHWFDWVDCNCPYSEKGYMCKHMAAAFYLMESQYEDFPQWIEDSIELEDEDLASEDVGIKELDDLPEKTNSPDRRKEEEVDLPLRFQEFAELQRREISRHLQEYEEDTQLVDPGEYRYFQYEKYRQGLVIPKKSLEGGKELLSSQTMRFDIRIGYMDRHDNNQEMIGWATGRGLFDYMETKLIFERNRIASAVCGKWDCRSRATSKSHLGHVLCKHETAVLLYLEQFLKEHNPGDFSNRTGMSLINSMSFSSSDGKKAKKQEVPKQELNIEPILHVKEDRRCSLSFKVGHSRLYVIKNISEFMNHVRKEETMTFGKKTEMQMGRAYISMDSLPLLDYISDALEEMIQLRKNMIVGDILPAIEKEIPLYGNNLDRFFDLIFGKKSIECAKRSYESNREKKFQLTAMERDYRPDLLIRPAMYDENFGGISLTGKIPDIYYGQKYSYYIEDSYLIRFPLETAKKLEPLMTIRGIVDDRIDARIGRRYLTDFYRKVLPSFEDAVNIEEIESEVIHNYLDPEPVFLCYLDVDEGMMLCRVDAIYGSRVHHIIKEIIFRDVIPNYRNIDKEEELLHLLEQYFHNTGVDVLALFSDVDEDNTFLFLSEGLPKLMEIAEVHMTDRFKRLGIRRNIHFNMGVSIESGILDFDVTAEGYSKEELMEILGAYRRKARYIRLKDGDFLNIDQNESIAELSELMESMKLTPKQFVNGKMHIPAYRALYLDKMMEQSQFIEADRNKSFRRLIREIDTANNADYDIPHSLKNVLRNYQKEGYQWLRTLDHLHFGGILADEMGLGKTLQMIAVLLAVKEEKNQAGTDDHLIFDDSEYEPSLIVCPASLVYNWEDELGRFASALKVGTVSGHKTVRRGIIEEYQNYDVLITSYDLLKRDIDEYEARKFLFMVLDEAQYIKNAGTAAAKSVKLILSQTKFALTGTPIENRLSDMWSIFDYLMPGFLYDYHSFRSQYETPIVKNGDRELAEKLSRMVGPFILRRKKREVLKDLPDKLQEIRYASMESMQQKLYDAQVTRLRQSLDKQNDDEFRRNRIQVLAELTKLRQICCDPSLYYENYDGSSAKREACLQLINTIIEGEHKALIFSQFTTMLQILENDLKKEGIPYYIITGATLKEKRMQLVKAFNNNNVPIFLISLKAGGTGLNLTGADVVVHYDPWWNFAVQNQATDRAHRIGQTQIVTVFKLIAKGSIEEKILEMQESKKQLAQNILNSENAGSTTISREDLLTLLD